MKKIILILLVSLPIFIYSQQDILLAAKTRTELIKNLDSALRSCHFITDADAEKILGKPAHLKDSTYKFSSGVLRYSFNYVADYVDSTSKGRIFFSFEQYKDTAMAKSNYEVLKTENQKGDKFTSLKELGNAAFLNKDIFNQPLIIVLEDNKIYKLNILYLTTENSLNELMKVSVKIVAAH